MKTIKTIILSVIIFSASYLNAQSEYKKFSFSVGTDVVFPGLSRVNGGGYTNPSLAATYSGKPWDFKAAFIPLSFAASARYNWFEPLIELQLINFKSDVISGTSNQKSDLNFVNFNVGSRFRPIKPMYGIDPYVEAILYLPIYHLVSDVNPDTTNPNSEIISDRNIGLGALLGFYVGGDYMFTKNLGAYLQLGYGFELIQFGAKIKL